MTAVLPLLSISNNSNNKQMCPSTPYQELLSEYALDGLFLSPRFQFTTKIGAGTYGLIYGIRDVNTGKQYAVKMILNNPPIRQCLTRDVAANKIYIMKRIHHYFSMCYDQEPPAQLDLETIRQNAVHCPFLREIALQLVVHDHPNITTLHQVLSLGDEAVAIVMDYYPQGDLFGNIIEKGLFSNPPPYQNRQRLMANVMLQLVDAINYCHQQGIYHCDLKPENIMVQYNREYRRSEQDCGPNTIINYDEIRVLLIDFGLAMNSNIICCNACRGSSFYMAPERITNYNTNKLLAKLVDMDQFSTPEPENEDESSAKYLPTLAGDIWSLGVLFINITCSRNPWPIALFLPEKSANGESKVFATYMLQDKLVLQSILPITKEFDRILETIFRLDPNKRSDLPTLEKEISSCNHFVTDCPIGVCSVYAKQHQDMHKICPIRNPQLATPPEISQDYEWPDHKVGKLNGAEAPPTTPTSLSPSPVPSIMLKQCPDKVRLFECEGHAL